MIILGIDPGTATTGYGVVDFGNRHELRLITYGTIKTPAKVCLSERLTLIHSGVVQLIDAHAPDAVSVEQLFFSRNTSSALSVGHARGVILLAAAQAGISVSEYTPLQVKQAVTGEGRASKQQVAYMVKLLLGMKDIPTPDDAADALAIAICDGHHVDGNARRSAAKDGYIARGVTT